MPNEHGHVSDPNRREFLAHVGGAAATVDGVASLATIATEADETTTGPGSLMAVDPDGNTILGDQHV